MARGSGQEGAHRGETGGKFRRHGDWQAVQTTIERDFDLIPILHAKGLSVLCIHRQKGRAAPLRDCRGLGAEFLAAKNMLAWYNEPSAWVASERGGDGAQSPCCTIDAARFQ